MDPDTRQDIIGYRNKSPSVYSDKVVAPGTIRLRSGDKLQSLRNVFKAWINLNPTFLPGSFERYEAG